MGTRYFSQNGRKDGATMFWLKERARERPFLVLAILTLVVGAVWHLSGVGPDDGPLGFALFAISYVLGTPFIVAMRLVGSVVTHPALRGALGFVLGILPYLAADEALRRRRRRLGRRALQGPSAPHADE